MAITIVTTAGSATANSYATIAETDEYALSTVWQSTWAALSDEEKNSILVRAARSLDTIGFHGRPTADSQALEFPRTEAYYPSGNMYSTTLVPQTIADAQMHIACYLSKDITEDPFEISDASNVKKEKFIDVVGEKEYWQKQASDGSEFLSGVIAPMLRNTGLLGPASSVRLTR